LDKAANLNSAERGFKKMKKLFRKAVTILGSAGMIGATVGMAAAAAFPAPFDSNTAIVVGTGTGVAPSDNLAAIDIVSYLNANTAADVTLDGGSSLTEDEIALGTAIDASGEFSSGTLDEGDLSALMDETLAWDDGVDSDDYDIHEEILVSEGNNMEILTTLDDDELEGVALSNNKALGYRLVFDDALNWSLVGDDDADALYLNIMGKSYEVSGMDATDDTVKVVTSEEVSLSVGESVTVAGKVFTVDDIYDTTVQVNGEFIDVDESEKIDGVRVRVDTIAYHDNAPELSKVILRVGEEIEETFANGDEYIGQDEDEPLWIWDIDLVDGAESYIGVSYNVNINDANDDDAGDSIKYAGDSYILPEGFGGVTLVGTNDVNYQDVEVSFDEVDLYNASDDAIAVEGQDVMVLTVPDGSFTAASTGDDSTEIYLFFNASAGTNGSVELYYKDLEGEYSPSGKARLDDSFDLGVGDDLDEIVTSLEIDDLDVNIWVSTGDSAAEAFLVTFETTDAAENITLTVGEVADNDGFSQLGATIEDADDDDVVIGGTVVGTKDVSIMDHFGIIVGDGAIEDQADSDEITISFPDEQVFAEVKVTAGSEGSSSSAGVMIVDDAEVSSVSGKNLIVVGGSAINSVAADLLGGAYSQAAFTSATGVAAGEFLINSYERAGKTALLVAGYNAADTEKAVTYLLNEAPETSQGTKIKGTSATEATVVTA